MPHCTRPFRVMQSVQNRACEENRARARTEHGVAHREVVVVLGRRADGCRCGLQNRRGALRGVPVQVCAADAAECARPRPTSALGLGSLPPHVCISPVQLQLDGGALPSLLSLPCGRAVELRRDAMLQHVAPRCNITWWVATRCVVLQAQHKMVQHVPLGLPRCALARRCSSTGASRRPLEYPLSDSLSHFFEYSLSTP